MTLTRFRMYQAISQTIGGSLKGEVLSVSGIADFSNYVDLSEARVFEADYPQYDMQDLKLTSSSFDAVVSDQVIEHLKNPWSAVKEACRVVRPGGYVIVTSCFLNPLHPSPDDYWRFSVQGMGCLGEAAGLDLLTVAGWGNRFALTLISYSSRARRLKVKKPKGLLYRIATANNHKCAIVTWFVARKPRT